MADSGLPTYRGVGGLGEGALTDVGLPIEQALPGTMFAERPDIAWRYLAQIEAERRRLPPTPATTPSRASRALHGAVTVLTQNVDGFHLAAGSRDVIEMHGTLRRCAASTAAASGRSIAGRWACRSRGVSALVAA